MKKEHQNIKDDKWLKQQDEYSYNVSVTIDAENALDNKFLKENIKNAVINCLNAYDVIVDVEDI